MSLHTFIPLILSLFLFLYRNVSNICVCRLEHEHVALFPSQLKKKKQKRSSRLLAFFFWSLRMEVVVFFYFGEGKCHVNQETGGY